MNLSFQPYKEHPKRTPYVAGALVLMQTIFGIRNENEIHSDDDSEFKVYDLMSSSQFKYLPGSSGVRVFWADNFLTASFAKGAIYIPPPLAIWSVLECAEARGCFCTPLVCLHHQKFLSEDKGIIIVFSEVLRLVRPAFSVCSRFRPSVY